MNKDVNDAAVEAIEGGATPDQVSEVVRARAYGANKRIVAPPAPAEELQTTQDTSRRLAELLNDPELLNPPLRISTTFTALDIALSGGLVRRGLYVLAGLTGRGKSTLTANLGRRIGATGIDTLWITLEDEDIACARKLVAQEANVPILALENYQKPGAMSEDERANTAAALARLAELPLRIDCTASDIDALERLVELLAEQGTQVVLIDQSSWVHAPDASSPFEDASAVARRLKILAKRLKIVIVVLVQVNRTGAAAVRDGAELELFHIRDTGKWEEDADAVLIIQSIDQATSGAALMCIDLKKNRRGKSGQRIYLLANLTIGLVEDSPLHLEPEDLNKQKGTKGKDDSEKWNVARFIKVCCREVAEPEVVIVGRAEDAGLKAAPANRLFKRALGEERIFQYPGRSNEPRRFSTVRPQLIPDVPKDATRKPGRPRKIINTD